MESLESYNKHDSHKTFGISIPLNTLFQQNSESKLNWFLSFLAGLSPAQQRPQGVGVGVRAPQRAGTLEVAID